MVWDVPVDIMSSVFCELSLYQKLQCESVCKDWMQLLRGWHPESTRQLSSAMWGKQLAVYDWSTKSDKIEFSQQPAEKIVLTLKPEMRPTASRAALGRWLTRVSVVVDTLKVFLSPYSDGGWVLPHLLTALYLSRQSALLGPELHLTTGGVTFSGQPISLGMLADFLTDWTVTLNTLSAQQQAWHVMPHLTSLTCLYIDDASSDTGTDSLPDMKELRALTRLRTLCLPGYVDLAKQVHSFTNIQELELSYGEAILVDLGCLNLLTALTLQDDSPRCFQTLILPEGKEVWLQRLNVSCSDYEPEKRFEMHNLQMAVHLTSLYLRCVDPDNLREAGWPQAMPCLSDLTLHSTLCHPPSQLQFYPMLRSLNLSNIKVDALPDWVSNLTQLQHLSLCSGKFEQGFPQIVLELSQLQSLDLQLMQAPAFPEKVVECAAWPNLSMLNLEMGHSLSDKFMSSLDSHIVLLLLMKAFNDAGKQSPLVLDKVYIEEQTC